jgi:hypothetical protein
VGPTCQRAMLVTILTHLDYFDTRTEFRDLNDRFESLGTGMTQHHKLTYIYIYTTSIIYSSWVIWANNEKC